MHIMQCSSHNMFYFSVSPFIISYLQKVYFSIVIFFFLVISMLRSFMCLCIYLDVHQKNDRCLDENNSWNIPFNFEYNDFQLFVVPFVVALNADQTSGGNKTSGPA